MNDCKLAVAPKLDHAIVFIKWLADMFAEPGYIDCGCTSDAGNRPEVLIEVSSIGNTSQIKFLPYDHSIEVFNEYENFYHRTRIEFTSFRKGDMWYQYIS